MRFQFQKMQGCGNDFLIYDQMSDSEMTVLKKNEVQYLCDRHYGVGADGLVILAKGGDRAHVTWRFFNSDGSEAEMCGNAARCAIKFLTDNYFPDEDVITIETLAGILKGKVNKDVGGVEVTLFSRGDTRADFVEKLIKSDNEVVRCFCIDTGVPHAVIEVKDIHNYPIQRIGHMVMFHPAFQPELTNVTFFQQRVGPQIIATTFERGVEAETLGCGTGAAAAAMVFSELYMQPFPITVMMPGGTMVVDQSSVAKRMLLRGEAEYITVAHLEDIPTDFEPRHTFGKVIS